MLSKMKIILEDLLDVEPDEIQENTYLIRDLEAESIDLLELSIMLNNEFGIKTADDIAFLKRIREKFSQCDDIEAVQKGYPHLTLARIQEIKADLANGPTLQIRDIIQYIEWCLKK